MLECCGALDNVISTVYPTMALLRKEWGVSFSSSGRFRRCSSEACNGHPSEASALLATLRRCVDQDVPISPPNVLNTRPVCSLSDAYLVCEGITRQYSRSFFLSTHLLPLEKRRAIRALYAFCRMSDELVDRPGADAWQSLASWVALVDAPKAAPGNPVLVAWQDVIARYGVPRMLIDELLAGMAMDLTVSRYRTFDDLWLYCYRVASVVGLISLYILGTREGAMSYAIQLGVALQLTNILRDVGEDAVRGRIYLPQEDLMRFHLSDADIFAGCRDERFRALMRFESARAHRLYDGAWPGISLISPDSRLAVGTAAETYRGILARIIVQDYDVFSRRASVPLREKLIILLGVWWRLQRERVSPRCA